MTILLPELVTRLVPELTLLGGAVLCLVCGLAPQPQVRRMAVWAAVAPALLAAILCTAAKPDPHQAIGLPAWPMFVRLLISLVTVLVVLVQAGVPDRLKQILGAESAGRFEPGHDFRGEFFAFTLVSAAGAMLCAGAGDLVWLLLAIELTSLPTYIMIASARDDRRAKEAAVKYFFLGALAVAVFLYGGALMFGATGSTTFAGMRAHVAAHGVSNLMLAGTMLAVVGLSFKVAAAPMHAYTLDVYEGAATPVTTLLATLPKFAGFAALTLVLGCVGWLPGKDGLGALPLPIMALLSAMALGSMFIGNGMGLLQTRIKRIIGCSSIAQSGYLLLGLVAGPALYDSAVSVPANGLAALWFYLVAYALSTLGLLATLGALVDKDGREIELVEQLRGLRHRHPMAAVLVTVCSLSLMGLPALGGFLGKVMLGLAAFESPSAIGTWLVVALVLNSAISAGYYLRFAALPWLGESGAELHPLRTPGRRVAALVATAVVVALGGLAADPLMRRAAKACAPDTGDEPTAVSSAEQP